MDWVFPGFSNPGAPGSLVKRRDGQQMSLEFVNGSVWRLIGTDKMENVGAGPVGVVFSEYSLCRPSSYDFVRPMLRENGGWAWFIFTPRGRNHAQKLFERNKGRAGWFVDVQTVHQTGLQYESDTEPGRMLTPDEMMQEERASGMEEALIRQEYLCDFSAALVGSVWGDLVEALEKRGRLEAFEHPPDGVFTVWDLGISDATAIWFFRVNGNNVPDLIDHYEATGKPASHYFDELEKRGYRYVRHWLPPTDGRARTWQTGVANVQLLIDWCRKDEAKRGSPSITPDLGMADGIQAGRWLLQQPIRIHPRCGEGIEALRQYHYAWDEDRKVFSRSPEHDWSSHTADAFRYVACVARASDLMQRRPDNTKRGPIAKPVDRAVTLEELWAEQPTKSGRI
jgi:hypothetical protein